MSASTSAARCTTRPDSVGRLLFNVLAMVAEFEAELIRAHARGREGREGRQGQGPPARQQPKLTERQEAHLVALHLSGENASAELAELFNVARSTVS